MSAIINCPLSGNSDAPKCYEYTVIILGVLVCCLLGLAFFTATMQKKHLTSANISSVDNTNFHFQVSTSVSNIQAELKEMRSDLEKLKKKNE